MASVLDRQRIGSRVVGCECRNAHMTSHRGPADRGVKSRFYTPAQEMPASRGTHSARLPCGGGRGVRPQVRVHGNGGGEGDFGLGHGGRGTMDRLDSSWNFPMDFWRMGFWTCRGTFLSCLLEGDGVESIRAGELEWSLGPWRVSEDSGWE